MKINIQMKTESGYKPYEIEGYPVFEMYGHKFVAHRAINAPKKDGGWNYIRQDWRVSEAAAGAVLLIGYENFPDAVISAEEYLKNKGAEKFFRAIERVKKEGCA